MIKITLKKLQKTHLKQNIKKLWVSKDFCTVLVVQHSTRRMKKLEYFYSDDSFHIPAPAFWLTADGIKNWTATLLNSFIAFLIQVFGFFMQHSDLYWMMFSAFRRSADKWLKQHQSALQFTGQRCTHCDWLAAKRRRRSPGGDIKQVWMEGRLSRQTIFGSGVERWDYWLWLWFALSLLSRMDGVWEQLCKESTLHREHMQQVATEV